MSEAVEKKESRECQLFRQKGTMATVVNQESGNTLQLTQRHETVIDPRHSGLDVVVKQLTSVASWSHRPTKSIS